MKFFERQPKRRSQAKRSQSLSSQFSELLRRLEQFRETRKREQRLRAIRRSRERADAEEKTYKPLKKSPLRTWWRALQRRKKQEKQGQAWSLQSLVVPRSRGRVLLVQDAVVSLMRNAAKAILLLIIVTLALNAVPFRLVDPSWYLSILNYIAENVPVLVFVMILAVLSLALDPKPEKANNYRLSLRRFLNAGYFLVLLLLPIQIALTTWLYSSTYSQFRNQISAIKVESGALAASAAKTTTTDEFVAFLRSRNVSANLQSIAAAPLGQVKSEFLKSLEISSLQQQRQIEATARSTYLRYGIAAVKLFFYLLVFVVLLRIFASYVASISVRIGPVVDEPQVDDASSV